MELGQKLYPLQNIMKNRKVLLINLPKTKVSFFKTMNFFSKNPIDLNTENNKGSITLTKASIKSSKPDKKF